MKEEKRREGRGGADGREGEDKESESRSGAGGERREGCAAGQHPDAGSPGG